MSDHKIRGTVKVNKMHYCVLGFSIEPVNEQSIIGQLQPRWDIHLENFVGM